MHIITNTGLSRVVESILHIIKQHNAVATVCSCNHSGPAHRSTTVCVVHYAAIQRGILYQITAFSVQL